MIYLSNFLETLRALLIENLYFSSSSAFTRRAIILPDLSLKDFLLQFMAHKLQIGAGLHFLTLAQALGFPSALELSLFLETEIARDPPSALKEYAEGASRRLSQLCDCLSHLFLQKALYAMPLLAWQESLWKKALKQYPELGLTRSFEGQQLHFFGFGFLPKALLDLFSQKGANFYLFSPCGAFWADYASEKEQLFALRRQKQAQEAQKQAYEESFEGQNSLLASLGKLGRKMQDQLLERSAVEQYICPEGESALATLQRQIFLGEKGEKAVSDDSLQLVAASTRMEEVQLLRKTLARQLVQGLLPQEIQVLSPDISLYAPYIRALFADEKIAVIIEDLPSSHIDPLFQALDHFFSLPEQRFDRACLRKLLAFSAVQEKFDLKQSDLSLLDLEERDFSDVEASQLELCDKFYRLLTGLKEDLADRSQSLSSWASHFALILQKYFSSTCESLLQHLRRLELAFAKNPQSVSYQSARKMVEDFIRGRRECLHPGHLQAIRFSSFSRSISPTACIYLLGMHEEAFPRNHRLCFSDSSFALDEDRYLFLQLLVSARKKLCISYPRTLPGQSEELQAAFIVQELGLTIERWEGISRQSGEKTETLPPITTEVPKSIPLRKLSKFVKDPQSFFLSESLGIYEEKPVNESAEFILSPLTKYKLCKKALKTELSIVLEEAERAHELPKHLFKEVAMKRLVHESEQERQHLTELGIAPQELFSITFSSTCKAPQILENGERLFPPFVVKLTEEQEIKLIGTIEEVTMQGLLVRGEGALLDQMRRAPLFLLFRLLFPEAGEELFLLKKAKKRTLKIQDPLGLLKSIMFKYLEALKGPVSLPPEELEAMLLQ